MPCRKKGCARRPATAAAPPRHEHQQPYGDRGQLAVHRVGTGTATTAEADRHGAPRVEPAGGLSRSTPVAPAEGLVARTGGRTGPLRSATTAPARTRRASTNGESTTLPRMPPLRLARRGQPPPGNLPGSHRVRCPSEPRYGQAPTVIRPVASPTIVSEDEAMTTTQAPTGSRNSRVPTPVIESWGRSDQVSLYLDCCELDAPRALVDSSRHGGIT